MTDAEKKEFVYKKRRLKNAMSALKSRERKRAKIIKFEQTVAELRSDVKRLKTENSQLRKKLMQQRERSPKQTDNCSPDSPHSLNKLPQAQAQADECTCSGLIPATNSERLFSGHPNQLPDSTHSLNKLPQCSRLFPSTDPEKIFSEYPNQLNPLTKKHSQTDGSNRFIPSTNSDRLFSEHSMYPLQSFQHKRPETDGCSSLISSTNLDSLFSGHSKQLNPFGSEKSAPCQSQHPHNGSSDLLAMEGDGDDFGSDFDDMDFLDDLRNVSDMDYRHVPTACKLPNIYW